MAKSKAPRFKPPVSMEYVAQIEYAGMDEILALYADAAVVAHSDKDYSLYFFQTQLPKQIKGASGLSNKTRARCVARIVFSPKLMLDLFKAMRDNIERDPKFPKTDGDTEGGTAE